MGEEKFKILFDASILSNYNIKNGHRAGLFFVALNLLKEFQKKDILIELYCSYTEYYKLKNIKEFQHLILVPEISVIHKFISFIFYLLQFVPTELQPCVKILSRLCNEYIFVRNKKRLDYLSKFDAYFSPFSPPPKEIEQSEIKCFRMIHDTIPIVESGMPKSPTDWYYKIYSTINEKDFYFTNSEYTKQDLIKYFPFVHDDHVKTTLLGANEKFKPSNEPSPIGGKFIFSLCSLGKRKNLEFCIRNFFEFTKKNNINDLKLVLGGSVWQKYKQELDSVLGKYDRRKIILTGYIDETDLPKYYSNALMFVYPSLYEGFGLPVLEAMQCGCPVITSNVTSLPEVIGDAGIKINPKSDEEMIAAYEKMYYDEKYREKCSIKGIERSKLFGWEKCAGQILGFIKEKIS